MTSSLKKIGLLTIFGLPVIISYAAIIDKIEAPAIITAKETATIRIITHPGDEPITLTNSLTGKSSTLPPGLRFIPAAKSNASRNTCEPDSEAITGQAATGKGYSIIFQTPFPADGKTYHIWARTKSGSLCLKGVSGKTTKELKWDFGKTEKYQWHNFGKYDATAVGESIAFMTEQKEPFAKLDAVLLTTATPEVFNPTNIISEPGTLDWPTNISSAGIHKGTITAVTPSGKKEVKEFTIEVTAPEKAKTKNSSIAMPGTATPLPLASIAVDSALYPLLNFPSDKLAPIIKKSGIAFPATGKFIALRCNKYAELPAEITIPVNGTYSGLAFVLSEYWQGDVGQDMASITVNYANGTTVAIPLREEFELVGSLRDPQAQNAIPLGSLWNGGTELHVCMLPWVNPHPELKIDKLVFSNLRRVFSPEENKIIPLNVTAESSQIILGLAGLDTTRLNSLRQQINQKENTLNNQFATVDFSAKQGAINPMLFGTNETGITNTDTPKFDNYLNLMKSIDCRIFRIHSGWSLEKVYPEGLKSPRYDKLAEGIGKLRSASKQWQVMLCFNNIPKYIDPKTDAGRRQFAELTADLVRELNIKRHLGIAYWEIYNEVYFKELDPDRSLWKMYNLAATAMKKVDPSIKIGGYAPCWPSIDKIRDFYRNCHSNTDFISWHKYLTGSSKTPDDYLMDKAATFGTDAAEVRRIVKEITPGKKVELALTEFNINWNWKPHDPRQASYVGSAWFATVLINLIRNNVDIAQNWHSRNGGTFGMIGDEGEIRPVARLYYLGNRYLAGGNYVASSTTSNRFACLGFTDKEGKQGLLLVNHEVNPLRVKISLLNLSPSKATPFECNTMEYSINEKGYEVIESENPLFPELELTLSPFEVRLIVSSPGNR